MTIQAKRILFLVMLALPAAAAPFPTARPEEVGFSGDRLGRIHEMVERHIKAQDISGAVSIVARRGRIVFSEAQGLADIESAKPMTRDALFRLASSSKPVTAAAVLIMMEE